MYKLLALDLDGTLLNAEHGISPYLVETVKQLSKKMHVIIVTGRHHTAAQPYYRELGLDTPIICCNGTYTYDFKNDVVVQENAIHKDVAAEFITLSEQHSLKAVMYVKDAMLYSSQRPTAYMAPLLQWAKSFPEHQQPNIRQVANFHHELRNTEYVWKFVVESDDMDAFLDIDFVRNNFNAERSWVDRIDFASMGNSKGTALTHYVEQIGISLDECVAVGDNHNDISMLKAAGLGVAMKNADQAVKDAANIITEKTHNDAFCLSELFLRLF